MDDHATPAPVTSAPSPWIAAAACSAILLLAALGGIAALRQQSRTELAEANAHNQAAISALTTRVSALEAQTASLASKPTDTAPIDAVNANLAATTATVNGQLQQLATRLAALETKPAPAVAAPAPVVENTVPKAPAGPTDDVLRAQLRQILDTLQTPAPAVTGNSVIDGINARFSGLIAIKKQAAPDAYSPLRAQAASADIPTLTREVEALPDTARAPFAAWLATVHAREAALTPSAKMAP